MDVVSELENALGAELLRTQLLHRAQPKLGRRYIIERVLGRGASGLVVAALDDRLNRPVALKIRPAEGDTAMLAEARALARLSHPNVVRVHDVEVANTSLDGREFKLWLVSMERIEGLTMRAWLRAKPRTAQEIVAVFIDVGRGLAAAHAERIVHRDVKPDNVIVRPDGVAQVLDFGFAVQAASTQSEMGGVRPVAGTDPYMSPEARLGRTSRRSDQFSLGVTLVEALIGSALPAGKRVPKGVPRPVWEVAQRATAADAEDRFDDMTCMVDELVRASRTPISRTKPMVIAALCCAVPVAAFPFVQIWMENAPTVPTRTAPILESLDASVAADADPNDAGLATDATLVDATNESDAGNDAPSSSEPDCPPIRRRVFDFHTTSDGSDVRHGCYVLTVTPQDRCAVTYTLERRGYGNQPHCETRSYARLASDVARVDPEGRFAVVAPLNGRTYTFDFHVGNGRVMGSFSVDARTGSYRGEITDDGVP